MLASALQALEHGIRGASGRQRALLRDVQVALLDGSVPTAIRLVDWAWRTMPDCAELLAPIYGRLMSLGDRDHDAALRLLQEVDVPDADVAALVTRAQLRLRRSNDGMQNLAVALQRFSVAPDGLLAEEASAALRSPGTQALGWIGLGPTLMFAGELTAGANVESLQIRLGQTVLEHPVETVARNGRTTFSFSAPQLEGEGTLHVSIDGVPLLGSGYRLPLDFALDGRAGSDGKWIVGWARIGWLPERPVQLQFEDETGRTHSLAPRGIAGPGYRWPFRLDARKAGLRGSRICISAQLPDGRWRPLPDTPLLLAPAIRGVAMIRASLPRRRPGVALLSKHIQQAAPKPSPLIDVVIPVHGGRLETLACIDAVLTTIEQRGRVVVIDDATQDTALAAALDQLGADGRIVLVRNEKNLGFVGSVNRALAMNSTRDIVLLNSDTLVFNDWLQRLCAAAYSGPRVGSVTPLSNDGSIASYPRESGGPIHPEEAAALDKLAAWTHPRISIEIPVGVGFCLYLRSDCVAEVGQFDESVFGMGYGEEVDFCMRAREKGWSHRIAADVFVYHAGGRSFGSRRAALLDRSQRLLNLRYPGYDRFIEDFVALAPIHPVRRRLDERRLCSFEGRFILLLTLALEGGVERFVGERCRQIRAQGAYPLVLKPQKAGDSACCELWTDGIDAPNLRYRIPKELSELTALLGHLRIDQIDIQHFLDLDAKLVEAVRTLGVPYVIAVHDYAWICPRVTLIDGSGRYCGEPAVSVCKTCVEKNGSRLGEPISVPALRRRSALWLEQASRVSAPSADTVARLKNYFPGVDIDVRPHTVPLVPPSSTLGSRRGNGTVRVALIGAIGGHKGYEILLGCARDAAKRRLSLEFVVIGYTEGDGALLKTGKVFITGRYTEIEVPHLLLRERPDLIFLPSVWPETWCYTLDHAMQTGLPIAAFDLGAIAERLREAKLGILLPLELCPGEINDRLQAYLNEHRNQYAYVQRSELDHFDDARIKNNMETDKTNPPVSEPLKDEGLSASVQVLPLPGGLYLFSVKAAAAPGEHSSEKLRLPAMHVGLGPGTRSEHVEFLSGPATEGAWLFALGDVLVAKVSASGATLILTSVRASNGEVLSIAVERLEARSQLTISTPPESAVVHIPLPASAREPQEEVPAQPATKPAGVTADPLSVPLQIKTHIRTRGDTTFSDAPWAGRVAPGLWIESFSIQPLNHLSAQDIEYKGLTGTGFETPWISEDQNCGTKGISVPLVGFAIRLKPSAATAAYECEYSGYYRSGVTVGPLRKGAPCRSMVANDPLEGIQIRISRRAKEATVASIAGFPAAAKAEAVRATAIVPSFGRYRDGDAASGNVASSASQSMPKVAAPKAVKRAKATSPDGTSERRPPSTRRPQNRNS